MTKVFDTASQNKAAAIEELENIYRSSRPNFDILPFLPFF